jgi:hypothetical protein
VKYRVIGHVTISVSVVVEAESKAAARKIARDAGMQSFCHSCASGEDDAWSTSGELDGQVTIQGVEEA